jgi:hypothetical protein
VPPASGVKRIALTRVAAAALGYASIAWGASVLPAFWQHVPIEAIGNRIIGGEPFKTELLIRMIPALETAEQADNCRPTVLHASAIVRLRILEDAIDSGQRQRIDSDMASLRDQVRRAMACSPADPFLWLVLFWVENSQNGYRPDHLKYLRMSYRLGPNEGWISLKRNRIAFAVFEQLPEDMAGLVITEFVSLINSAMYREAVAIFVGPAWRSRGVILPRLNNVAEANREFFAKLLYSQGYDVTVPGTQRPEWRPWH